MGLWDKLRGKEQPVVKSASASEKKRGQYKKVECPHCHTYVGNLQNHIRMKHQTPADKSQPPPAKTLTKDDLIIGAPPPDEPKVYYCTGCKAELRKGENPCWNCQAVLIWDGLE